MHYLVQKGRNRKSIIIFVSQNRKMTDKSSALEDTTSSSLNSLSFLNRTFTPSPSSAKKKRTRKSYVSTSENGLQIDLVPSASKSKPKWNFDELSASLSNTSDILDRIDSLNSKNEGDTSGKLNVKDQFMDENGEVDYDKVRERTEFIKKMTNRDRGTSMIKTNLNEAPQRIMHDDDDVTMDIKIPSTKSTPAKSIASSSASSTNEDQTYNDTYNSFQFPLQLWKKSEDDNLQDSAMGPPMRKNGDKLESNVSKQQLSHQKSKDSSVSSDGVDSYGSLFRSSTSSAEEITKQSTNNTSYISSESEMTFNSINSSHDSLKLSSTIESSSKIPPRSPATNLSSSSDSSVFNNINISSPSVKKISNKRPPRSPSIASSPSILDSPSRNTRSKKSRTGPSPSKSSRRTSPRRKTPSPSKVNSSPNSSPRRAPRRSPRRSPRKAPNDDSPARKTRQQTRSSSPSQSSSSSIPSPPESKNTSSSSLLSSPSLSFLNSSFSLSTSSIESTNNHNNQSNGNNSSSAISKQKNNLMIDMQKEGEATNNTKLNTDGNNKVSTDDKYHDTNTRNNVCETADTETLESLMHELQDESTTIDFKKKPNRRLTADLSDLRSLSLLADPPAVSFKETHVNTDTTPPNKSCSTRVHTPYSKDDSMNDTSILSTSNNDANTSMFHDKAVSKSLKGILNSNRKQSSRKSTSINPSYRKTIAFGSPEVAEFNSNSPSGNFTPLPARQARALFKIPSSQSNKFEGDCFDSTTSPINKVDDTTTIEVDVHSLLNNTKFDDHHRTNNSAVNNSDTVELESNVEEIIQRKYKTTNSSYQSINSSMDVDQTDSQITKSINNTTFMSPIAESKEISDSSESMLFSPYSPCSPSILKEDRNSIASLNVNPFNDESMLDGDNIVMGKSLNFEEHFGSPKENEFSVTTFETRNTSTSEDFPPIGSSIMTHEKDAMNFLTSIAAANKSTLSMNEDMIRNVEKDDNEKRKCVWVQPKNMSFGVDDSLITNQNPLTCELEGNIEELVSCENHLDENAKTNTTNRSSEESSIKQMRRLTLTSPTKSKLLILKDENTNESYISIKGTQSHSKPVRKTRSYLETIDIDQHPALTISYDDILLDAGLTTKSFAVRDVLTKASENLYQSGNSSIVQTTNYFLSGACKEVQEQADTSNIENFNDILKENTKQIILKSQHIRGFDLERHLRGQFTQLLQQVYSNVSSECMQWEMQVIATLNDAILRLSSNLENEERTAKMQMNLIDDAFESIEVAEEKLIRKARRKSMCRRKVCSVVIDNLKINIDTLFVLEC